jgi:hypothetical protein
MLSVGSPWLGVAMGAQLLPVWAPTSRPSHDVARFLWVRPGCYPHPTSSLHSPPVLFSSKQMPLLHPLHAPSVPSSLYGLGHLSPHRKEAGSRVLCEFEEQPGAELSPGDSPSTRSHWEALDPPSGYSAPCFLPEAPSESACWAPAPSHPSLSSSLF